PFLIHVTGSATAAPQIAVTGATGKNLANGNSYLNFGSVTVEEKSAGQTVTIRNAGTATLKNLSVTRTGNHAGEFTVTPLTRTSLAPGASAKVRVTFRPSKASPRWATLRIKSNDADARYFDIVLTGTGKATAVTKGGKKKKAKVKTSPAKPIAPPTVTIMTKGVEVIDGKKYRTLTLTLAKGDSHTSDDFEVSGDLTNWSSGKNHVSVLIDTPTTFKVRDNMPVTETRKRHIRSRR
ncbi:MAG: choice-of-anchor D domain-containing protein, partial [Verrucomicrobiaceae bacterium]